MIDTSSTRVKTEDLTVTFLKNRTKGVRFIQFSMKPINNSLMSCSSLEGVLRRERGGGERVGGEAMSHSIIERGRERQKGASGEREHLN